MTRRKVKLAYITNDSKRRATFNKRKKGLFKKVDEITTLCGTEGCAIILGQNNPEPEVWPSSSGVHNVLTRFRGLPPLEQTKKMQNQESFLRERIHKGEEQLNKLKNEIRKKELAHLMFQCINAGQVFDNVAFNDLNGLYWLIDQNMKEIERCMEVKQAAMVVENRAENVIGREQEIERRVDETQAAAVVENVIGMEQEIGRHMEEMQVAAVVEDRAENVIGMEREIERRMEEMQVAAVAENPAENVIGTELGMESNVGAMPAQQWPMDFMTDDYNFGDLLPFENGNNVPNGFWL